MSVPISQMWTVASYVLRQKLRGRARYPLVLMLEPLFRCNLACAGCGKIQYPAHILRRHLSVEECLRAVDECGAPMVSIPGGEPLMYPEIGALVEELVTRKKYVYLCTNAILLAQRLQENVFEPSQLLLVQHSPRRAARRARRGGVPGRRLRRGAGRHPGGAAAGVPCHHQHHALRGRRPRTGAPVLRRHDGPWRRGHDDLAWLQLRQGPRPGALPAPAAGPRSSSRPSSSAPAAAGASTSRRSSSNSSWASSTSSARPWGNPTYNLFGWQRPCYLLQEGYAASFRELMETTRWERYGRRSGNPKCQDCMVHCGLRAHGGRLHLQLLARLPGGARRRRHRPSLSAMDEERSLEGWDPRVGDEAKLEEVVDLAFDYRGDVTVVLDRRPRPHRLRLQSRRDVPRPAIFMLFDPSGDSHTLRYAEIRTMKFTGKDTAAGKSYEAWLRRKDASSTRRDACAGPHRRRGRGPAPGPPSASGPRDRRGWPHYRSGALEILCVGLRARLLAARAVVDAGPPTLVISAGACGALDPQLRRGDLVVPETVVVPPGTAQPHRSRPRPGPARCRC